jgi:Concanavalin A-like lectin/glucanases superfamily
MTGPWQLICHHTYSGTPGVVYDLSPGHGSHGEALGLGATEFTIDGAQPGSGAVRIRSDFHQIEIPQGPFWSQLDGLRGEVTVRLDSQTAGLGLHADGGWRWLLSSLNCFQFAVIGQGLVASFSHGTGAATQDRVSTDATVKVPYDRWVTLGFLHDGLTTIELSIDGATVARTRPQRPVLPASGGVVVGNTDTRDYPKYPVVGSIDEVKIWRLKPDRITEQFFDRPMDDATRRCWEEFLRWLQRWREANPECAAELDRLITALVRETASRIAAAMESDRLAEVKDGYGTLWRDSRMGSTEIADLLRDFAAQLSENGIDPQRDDGYVRLVDSDCYRRLIDEMPSLDCDPEFAAYLEKLRDIAPRGRG